MNHYRITLSKAATGPEIGTYVVSATSPAVAVKRLLDGGHEAGYKYATVGPNRLLLKPGEAISIRIYRVKES